MNTTTTAKIKLTRVLPGWYSFNHSRAGLSFTVLEEMGFWKVEESDGETWVVDSLNAARNLIAAELAARVA